MATGAQEVAVRRIIACFVPGMRGAPRAIADLALETRAHLLGLFIEDDDLLRLAALPFAAEVGFASASLRALDAAAMQRVLRAQAESLRGAIAALLEPAAVGWSFRVARASLESAVAAALAEDPSPVLVIPPGANPRATRRVVRKFAVAELRFLRPVLILQDERP